MKIGIDFDGVIVRVDESNRAKISDALAEEYGIKIINPNTNLWAGRYDGRLFADKKLADEFLNRYFDTVAEYETTATGNANLTPLPNAVPAINKLKELKHELHLITARGALNKTNTQQYEQLTGTVKNKLRELGLVFDQYHFNKSEKVKIAQELGIDLMIDDKYSHIRQLTDANIQTIQLINPKTKSQRYATDVKGVKLATDWNEIVSEVNRMSVRLMPGPLHPATINGPKNVDKTNNLI
jgi:uncharacterized HAD superfamily protein